MKGISETLMVCLNVLSFISEGRDVFVLLSVAVRDSSFLLIDLRKVLRFFKDGLRIGWHKIAAIAGYWRILSIDLPRGEKGVLALFFPLVSTSHLNILILKIIYLNHTKISIT